MIQIEITQFTEKKIFLNLTEFMSADFLVLFYTTSAGEQYRKLNIDASFSIKVTKITLSLYITLGFQSTFTFII